MTHHNVALLFFVLLPLVGSLAVFSVPKTSPQLAKLIALGFSLAAVVYVAVLGFSFSTSSSQL